MSLSTLGSAWAVHYGLTARGRTVQKGGTDDLQLSQLQLHSCLHACSHPDCPFPAPMILMLHMHCPLAG